MSCTSSQALGTFRYPLRVLATWGILQVLEAQPHVLHRYHKSTLSHRRAIPKKRLTYRTLINLRITPPWDKLPLDLALLAMSSARNLPR